MSVRCGFILLLLMFLPEISNSVCATTSSSDNTAKTIIAMKHLLTTLFERYKRDMKALKSVVMSSNAAVNQMEANYKDLSFKLQNLESKVDGLLTVDNDNVIDDGAIVERASGKEENVVVSDDRISKLEELSRTYAARNCYELKAMGISKTGRYYIDPDGRELESNQPIEGNLIILFYCLQSIIFLKLTENNLSRTMFFSFSSLRYENRYH